MNEVLRRQVFTDIWERDLWGGGSGPGSGEEFAAPYAGALEGYLAGAVVVDIGCGDYRVGRRLRCREYIGIDIVPALIAQLQSQCTSPGVRFLCGDALTMELPAGEVCLIRQVLQHLSNAVAAALLARLVARYPIVVATDEIRGQGNDDKTTDGGVRANGLYLEEEPFNFHVEQVLTVVGGAQQWRVRTVRIGARA
jgi:SAM-dependent methyltransferase